MWICCIPIFKNATITLTDKAKEKYNRSNTQNNIINWPKNKLEIRNILIKI